MITVFSKEFDEVMDLFEEGSSRLAYIRSLERENRQRQEKGYFYTDKDTDKMFRIFLAGINHGMELNGRKEKNKSCAWLRSNLTRYAALKKPLSKIIQDFQDEIG